MPRGGPRQGVPGKNYANRSDMNMGPRKLPVTAATGQAYGAAKTETDAQRAVPIFTQPPTQDINAQAQQFSPPPVVPMSAPSNNPGEPLTAGMSTGIGPNAPTQLAASPLMKGVALLNQLGNDASPDVKAIRDVLSAQQANQATP